MASMRGRPGTRALPLAGGGRAVGGPIPLGLVAGWFGVALAGFTAAAVALIAAAPSLAGRQPLDVAPVLAVHLVALVFLPFAVTGAAFHLLPVMLRNDPASVFRLRTALPLLLGGALAAPGIAYDRPWLLWAGVALLAAGLALVLLELLGLVARAPGDRMLVVSRVGVALTSVHVVAALVLGAIVYSHGDDPFAGVSHGRWLLVHLHLAVLGWLALLILTVGRTLGPMLALAPSAPARRFPVAECSLTAGLWVLLLGLAVGRHSVALVGGAVVVATLGTFARLLLRVARTRHLALEAPLVHLLAGVAFLLQAAALGAAMLTGAMSSARGLVAYVIFLLLGWAAGVTLGHVGKLLSLSLWVWWPPGPRPKQDALYPRKVWLVEAAFFAVGVEGLAVGSLVGATWLDRAAGCLLAAAAVIAASGAWTTWSRRPQRVPPHMGQRSGGTARAIP